MEYRSELKQFGLTYFHLFTFSTRVYILGTIYYNLFVYPFYFIVFRTDIGLFFPDFGFSPLHLVLPPTFDSHADSTSLYGFRRLLASSLGDSR